MNEQALNSLMKALDPHCRVPGCRNIHEFHAKYCSKHLCEVEGCKELRADLSSYCTQHEAEFAKGWEEWEMWKELKARGYDSIAHFAAENCPTCQKVAELGSKRD